jgi:hypothetical protein
MVGRGGGVHPSKSSFTQRSELFEVVVHTYSMDTTDACPTYKVTKLVYQALTSTYFI